MVSLRDQTIKALRDQVAELVKERDEANESARAARITLDAAVSQLKVIGLERDEARAEAALLPLVRDERDGYRHERDELVRQLNDQNANFRAEADPEGEVAQARGEAAALRAEVKRLRDLSVWGTTQPVGPLYDEIRNLRALLRQVREDGDKLWASIDAALEGRDG